MVNGQSSTKRDRMQKGAGGDSTNSRCDFFACCRICRTSCHAAQKKMRLTVTGFQNHRRGRIFCTSAVIESEQTPLGLQIHFYLLKSSSQVVEPSSDRESPKAPISSAIKSLARLKDKLIMPRLIVADSAN